MDTQVYSFNTGQSPSGVTRLGNYIYIINRVDGTVQKFDLSGNLEATVNVDSLPVSIDNNGTNLYVCSQATITITEYDSDINPTGNSWSAVETPLEMKVFGGYFVTYSAGHVYAIENPSGVTVEHVIQFGSDIFDNAGTPTVLTEDGKVYTLDLGAGTNTLVGDWGLSHGTALIYHTPTASYYAADYSANTVYKLGAAPLKTDMVTGRVYKMFLISDILYLIDNIGDSIRKATVDGAGINPVSIVHTGETPVAALVDQNDDLWVCCQDADVVNKIMYWIGDETNPIVPVDELIELVYNTKDMPSSIVSDGANYWIACRGADTLMKMSPIGTTIREAATGDQPRSVTYLGGYIFVANTNAGTIGKYNKDGGLIATYGVSSNPFKIVTDGTYLYVLDYQNRKIFKYNQNVAEQIEYSATYIPNNIEWINGKLYVSADDTNDVFIYNSSLVQETAASGIAFNGPKYFTDDGASLFIASEDGNTLYKCQYDGTIIQQTPTYNTPKGLVYDSGYLWVITYLDSLLTRYDTTLSEYDSVNVGFHPIYIYTDNQFVWVLTEQDQAVKILSNVALADILPEQAFIHYDLETHCTDLHFDEGLFYIPAYFSNKFYIVNMNGSVVQEVATGNKPYKITTLPYNIAVYCKGENKVYIYNKSSFAYEADFAIGSELTSLANDGTYLWATSAGDTKVYKFTTSGVIEWQQSISLSPVKIRNHGQHMYVAMDSSHKVMKIDIDDHSYEEFTIPSIDIIDVGFTDNPIALSKSSDEMIKINSVGTPVYTVGTNRAPREIIYDGTYVWVIESVNNTISRYLGDAKVDSYYVPQYPYGIVSDGTDVWVLSLYGGKLTRVIVKRIDEYSGLEFQEAQNYPDAFIGTSENLNKPINDIKDNQQYFNEELTRIKGELGVSAGNFESLHERLAEIIDEDAEYVKGTVYTSEFDDEVSLLINISDSRDVIYSEGFYWVLSEDKLTRVAEDLREYEHFTYTGAIYNFIKFVKHEDLFYVLGDADFYKINEEGRIVYSVSLPSGGARDFTFDFENDAIWVAIPTYDKIVKLNLDTLVIEHQETIANGIQAIFFEEENDNLYCASYNNIIYRRDDNGTSIDTYLGGVNPIGVYATDLKLYTLNKSDSTIVQIDLVSHEIEKVEVTMSLPDRLTFTNDFFYVTSPVDQPGGLIDVYTSSLYKVDRYSLSLYNWGKIVERKIFTAGDDTISVHNINRTDLMEIIGGENISIERLGSKAIINNDLDPDDFKLYAKGDKFTITGVVAPWDLLFDGIYLWATSPDELVVKKYNAFGQFVSNIFLPDKPRNITQDSIHIYVSCDDNKIYKIDRASDAIITSWSTGTGPKEIMFHDLHVYVTCDSQNGVFVYDPDGVYVRTLGLTAPATSITTDQNDIYVVQTDDVISKFIADTGAWDWSEATDNAPTAVRFDGTSLWVAEHDNNTIAKYAIDGTLIDRYSVAGNPKDITFVDEYVIVALDDTDIIAKHNTLGQEVDTFVVGDGPRALDDDGPYVWVASEDDDALVRVQTVDARIRRIESGPGVRFYISEQVCTISTVSGTASSSGAVLNFVAGGTVAQGDFVILNSDSKVVRAIANDDDLAFPIGAATNSGVLDDTVEVTKFAEVIAGTFAPADIGKLLYLSDVDPGKVTTTPPSASGSWVVFVGRIQSTSTILCENPIPIYKNP